MSDWRTWLAASAMVAEVPSAKWWSSTSLSITSRPTWYQQSISPEHQSVPESCTSPQQSSG